MGGYFEIELKRGNGLYPHARAFNSARSALQALLSTCNVRRLFIPHYLCAVVPEAVQTIDVEVVRYELSETLELLHSVKLSDDDRLLYVDYFGLKTPYIQNVLAPHYGTRLIVDNSQALFSSPINDVATLYSPRKFVGVPDGGWLVNGPAQMNMPERGISTGRLTALLGRLADGPEPHYSAFLQAEKALGLEGLKSISTSTERLLESIDYHHIKTRRTENLSHLRSRLDRINRFSAWPTLPASAMCYPLLMASTTKATALREALLERNIYVPHYWQEVALAPTAPAMEKAWSARLLPLPIDQRYTLEDMDRLASIIHQAIETS
ncbi:MAG: hypothetical protein JWP80_3856 [Pseudomonas sp.]|nr:hypothetical protein [Pseudomonas sp.]